MTTPVVTGTDTEKAVQAALSKLGAKYVWGASGPDTFDCSGLVVWAFGQAGISMTRTTYTQVMQGTAVTGPPQRGDLVFPEAGHVMIALGGNQGVHAPDVGDVVKVSTYWTTPYAVRRMGPNSGTPGSVDSMSQFAAPSSGDVTYGHVVSLGKPIQSMVTFFNFLMSQHGWYRMLKIMLGVVMILIGSYFIAAEYTNM
jgi:NlpC/P60 family